MVDPKLSYSELADLFRMQQEWLENFKREKAVKLYGDLVREGVLPGPYYHDGMTMEERFYQQKPGLLRPQPKPNNAWHTPVPYKGFI